MGRYLSYGQIGLAVPLDDPVGVSHNEEDASGNINEHVNLLEISDTDRAIYLPGDSSGAAQQNYFDKNDNIIMENISYDVRGPDWIKEWIKDFGFSGEHQLTDGTYLQGMPYFGSFGGDGTPFYEQMRYIPPNLPVKLFFNTHLAAQALNTQFIIDYELSFKTTGTDLRAFWMEMDGNDYATHSLYINLVFAFRHSLPLTNVL